ncbi:flagellar hook-basal body complex protein FliE [Pelagovum pacificum]|uniref:Flagellar hook-basal body complex protein FliE n=1 Tax=Pelagovum pacificum TaxID=2588711 RepID=A0A5C5GGK4_9RHOB|nr:flagellar hook-basal body complex protein FliE [Pelagovum pacificum]QQA42983.1 flagellar hook-basal body complex protein FliE [Pelagovum pacificum]TNY33872.1 flagellar hook-basal body complex protein FliE [Pelagovum pacificum]
MDLRTSLLPHGYDKNRDATAPTSSPIGQAANEFMATLEAGEDAAMGGMAGKVDPHSMVQALARTELALETVVAVRDKVVEAYQEILRMPI